MPRFLVLTALLLCAARAAAEPIVTTSFRTSDGVRLAVLDTAPDDATGRPVIAFVTGWCMPASIFAGQMARLSDRYRIVALDPRGQGASDVPAEGYTLERRSTDIAEFLARHPRVVLVAWSLGALESLEYVRRFGDARLAGLVIVDSSVGEPPKPAGGGTFIADLRADRAKTLDGFVRAIFRTPQPDAETRALVEGALRMPLDASIALLSYPVPREHWRDIARSVRVPLAYVVSPQFAAQASSLRKHRPATEVHVYAKAGHALFVDEPDAFAAMLDAFARRTGQEAKGK